MVMIPAVGRPARAGVREGAAGMQSATDEAIAECVREAGSATTADRRQNRRYPFFRPITITIGGAEGTKLPAFSRDISRAGIGLLHNAPLEPQHVIVTIPRTADHTLNVPMEIIRCEPCGEGWYISGGRFIRWPALQMTTLLLGSIIVEAGRRLNQRHPFFRPVTITIGGAERTKIPAFSRDISPAGIGLFHNAPLEPQHVIVTIPRVADHPLNVPTKIVWCKACHHGWRLSGGRFRRLFIEELPALRW